MVNELVDDGRSETYLHGDELEVDVVLLARVADPRSLAPSAAESVDGNIPLLPGGGWWVSA